MEIRHECNKSSCIMCLSGYKCIKVEKAIPEVKLLYPIKTKASAEKDPILSKIKPG